MTPLSPWCWTPTGFVHTAAQHRACQLRQDEGQVGACSCEMHGGHESPSVDRDSRRTQVESETNRGPDRANESDPLATVSTTPKGA